MLFVFSFSNPTGLWEWGSIFISFSHFLWGLCLSYHCQLPDSLSLSDIHYGSGPSAPCGHSLRRCPRPCSNPWPSHWLREIYVHVGDSPSSQVSLTFSTCMYFYCHILEWPTATVTLWTLHFPEMLHCRCCKHALVQANSIFCMSFYKKL